MQGCTISTTPQTLMTETGRKHGKSKPQKGDAAHTPTPPTYIKHTIKHIHTHTHSNKDTYTHTNTHKHTNIHSQTNHNHFACRALFKSEDFIYTLGLCRGVGYLHIYSTALLHLLSHRKRKKTAWIPSPSSLSLPPSLSLHLSIFLSSYPTRFLL